MTHPEPSSGVATALRAARLARGLELSTLGRELKLPQATLEAMERGDWARLGAPVFARHLLARYAARLGVEVDCESVAGQLPGPELRSQVPRSRFGRFAEFSSRQFAYLGGSLLVLPLLYFSLAQWPDAGRSGAYALDPVPPGAPPAADTLAVAIPAAALDAPAPPPAAAAAPVSAPAPAAGPLATGTVAAGLTPSLPTAAPAPAQLELRFRDESWIEVFARDGTVLERVLARAGEARRWPLAQVGRVTIGNVEGTEVFVDGSGVNLEPVRAANVARFALSSDGAIEAVPR
jgi:cytoskeleton protein RodZ